MPDIHLKYGGSTATRTLNCANWQNIAETGPNINRESDAAKRGTMLHDIMEAHYDRDENLGELTKDLDPKDRDAVEYAKNALDAFLDARDLDDYVCEQLVTLDDDIGGSADMIACSDRQVAIIDFKFGHQPIKNRDQFLLYAACARRTPETADMFGDRDLVSVVIQPAVNSQLALVTPHTREELDDFENRFLDAVDLADQGGLDGNPGDWCQWCPAAGYCEAKRNQVYDFLTLDPKNEAALADAMGLVAQMKQQIKDVEAEAFRVLEAGGAVPGWKLVLKQARRFWTDPDKVRHLLRYNKSIKKEQYLEEPELKSVAQVEKLIGGLDGLAQYVDNRSSGTTIAPESDKRPAIEKGVVPDALSDIIGK